MRHPIKSSSNGNNTDATASKSSLPSQQQLEELDVLEGVIRAWAASAAVVESFGTSLSSGSEGGGSFASQELLRGSVGESTTLVMQVLFKCLQRHGAQFGECIVLHAKLRDRLREACARALIDMIKVFKFILLFRFLGRVFL